MQTIRKEKVVIIFPVTPLAFTEERFLTAMDERAPKSAESKLRSAFRVAEVLNHTVKTSRRPMENHGEDGFWPSDEFARPFEKTDALAYVVEFEFTEMAPE